MPDLSDLAERAAKLEHHFASLQKELRQLRQDLDLLQQTLSGNGGIGVASAADCLAVALASAADLGPGFSSEHPHDLAGRGDNWFEGT
jgi:hypothetical protein